MTYFITTPHYEHLNNERTNDIETRGPKMKINQIVGPKVKFGQKPICPGQKPLINL